MDSTMTAANELGSLAMAARIRRLCLLTALTTILPAFATEARPSFSRDSDSYQESGRHRHKSRRHKDEKEVRKEAPKPQGSLIIAISIDKQRIKVYDTNGVFAESQISTGMRGHRTPMGVFSVIQKQRFHRSNIYSNAPMPFMQRITWSGVAMHAGVVPGYPASHGCIRLPASFATKIWTWTRLGARVIVTPDDITPARFSHNLLTALSTAPQPPASADPAPVSDMKSPTPPATTAAPAAAKEAAPASEPNATTPGAGEAAADKAPPAPAEKMASAATTIATDAAVDKTTPPAVTVPAEKWPAPQRPWPPMRRPTGRRRNRRFPAPPRKRRPPMQLPTKRRRHRQFPRLPPSAMVRSRFSSAARTARSMCGRISRPCSMLR